MNLGGYGIGSFRFFEGFRPVDLGDFLLGGAVLGFGLPGKETLACFAEATGFEDKGVLENQFISFVGGRVGDLEQKGVRLMGQNGEGDANSFGEFVGVGEFVHWRLPADTEKD